MKKIKRNIIFCVLVIFFTNCSTAFAQLSATIKADSTHIEIGDHLRLHITLNTDNTKHFAVFPDFKDSIGGLEIVKKNKIDTAIFGNRKVLSQEVVVSAYDEGSFYISPIAFPYLNKELKKDDTLFTNDLLVTVKTLVVDTAQPIKPIKPPFKIPYLLSEFTWWIVGFIVAIIAIALAFYFYKKYKASKAKSPSRPKPKEPPHIWANKQLHILHENKLWQKGEIKAYYSRLSEILRLYLEYRFDYYALEATTEEIKLKISTLDIPPFAAKNLIEDLMLSDFVKFAKMNPSPDDNVQALEKAKQFIKNTIPVEEEIDKKVKTGNAK